MKMNFLYILIAFLLSCGKGGKETEPVIPPTFPPDSLPSQYGIPFTHVTEGPDAVIYQVNMRNFSEEGNFQEVTNRLDSIKALGINVIYLMPVTPVGILKSVNSPYCVRDYLSVNPEFGTLQDLRDLVAGAHSRNISVILDWVANHTSWDNAWITAHKDWYLQDAGGNILSPPGKGWADVAQLNFNNSAMRLAMIHAMKYWVYAANIDGFRCDYADGPPADFWKQAIDSLHTISSHRFLMMAEGTRSTNFAAGFDLNFGFRFYDQLKKIFSEDQPATSFEEVNTIEYTGAASDKRVVRYITNHDVNSSDGTPLDLFGGKKGSIAAFVVAAFMKGVPMIYNGQEVGTPVKLEFPFTTAHVDWSVNPQVTAEYKKIIAFRKSSRAVRRGQLTSYSTADVCAFTKEITGDKIFILANLRNKTIEYSIPASLNNSTWDNAMTQKEVSLKDTIVLPPYSYLVLQQS